MADRVYLSTYVLKLSNRGIKSDKLNLSSFKDDLDFFDTMIAFLEHLSLNPFDYATTKEKKIKTLQLYGTLYKNEKERTFYGYFESGVSGEKGNIKDVNNGEEVFKMKENHAKMIPTFFLLNIPANRRHAYVVLQRDSHFGIKDLFTRALKNYLDIQFDKKLILEVNAFLVGRLFNKFVESGSFHEISFIKNTVPDNIEDLYDKGHDKVTGKIKTVVSTTKSFPVKGLFTNLFYRDQKDGMIEVPELNDSFDDVDFEIEYNGTKKTIHINKARTNMPEFDITDSIDLDEDGNPTLESLKKQADMLVEDLIEYYEVKLDVK